MQSFPRKRVAAGTMIMHPSVKTDALYFIIEGRIRLYQMSPTGEEVFQGELGPGDCLKCPRVLCQHDCHTFAEAIVDCTLEVLPKPLFARLTRESVAFNQVLVREITYQIIDLDRRLYETSVMPMKVRLHAELLRLSQRRHDGTLVISPPPTQQELANRIGSQREAVSKELAHLSREGIVKRTRAAIVLVNEHAIQQEMADWKEGMSV